MAATSIPEVSSDAEMVAGQNDQDSTQPQLVALQNSGQSPVAQPLQVCTITLLWLDKLVCRDVFCEKKTPYRFCYFEYRLLIFLSF